MSTTKMRQCPRCKSIYTNADWCGEHYEGCATVEVYVVPVAETVPLMGERGLLVIPEPKEAS